MDTKRRLDRLIEQARDGLANAPDYTPGDYKTGMARYHYWAGMSRWPVKIGGSFSTVIPKRLTGFLNGLDEQIRWRTPEGSTKENWMGGVYSPTNGFSFSPISEFVDETRAVNVISHELGHWTGHKDRANRQSMSYSGVDLMFIRDLAPWLISQEEITAELIANLTSDMLGYRDDIHSTAYIASFMDPALHGKQVINDKRVALAAAHAETGFTQFIQPHL